MSQTENSQAPKAEADERASRLAGKSAVVAAFLARNPRALSALGSPPPVFTVAGWKAWLLRALLPHEVAADATTSHLEGAFTARVAAPNLRLDLASSLHAARQMAILIAIERAFAAPDEVGRTLAALCDAYLEVALLAAKAELAATYGRPLMHDAHPCRALIMALGGLGGAELSFGAPVELLYVYETDSGRIDGPTSSTDGVDLHAYFSRLFERVTALVADPAAGPFGFAVNLGRRPEGERGSICNSVEALASYYESFGHAWERLAWVKARPAAGDLELGLALNASLRPFVFRRHLDASLRSEIVAMRRRNDAAIAGGADDEIFDLYSSTGALRQIEFAVQMIQLIWGGQRQSLRVTSTLDALAAASSEALIEPDDARALREACIFYREALNGAALRGLAPQVSLVFGGAPVIHMLDGRAIDLEALLAHRAHVATQYAATSEGLSPASPVSETEARLIVFLETDAAAPARIEAARALGFQRPEMTLRAVDSLARRPQSPFHWRARTEGSPVASLAGRVVEAALASINPDDAFRHFEAFLRVVERRGHALVQLADDPERLRVLATLFGASHKLSGVLIRSPGLIDRLVLAGHEPALRDRAAMGALFAEESSLHPEGWEGALAAVRRAHAAETLRIGFFDLAGRLDAREVAAQLAFVAEAAIEIVVGAAVAAISGRFDIDMTAADFGVLACGRLAGRELGYDSPLELVFVHSPALETAVAARLARAVVTGLTCATPEGAPYEIGGPGGPSRGGPLCVTRARFLQYHREEAGLSARAAALRLRMLTGDRELAALVDEVRALAFGAFALAKAEAAEGVFSHDGATGPASPTAFNAIETIVLFHQLTLGAEATALVRDGHAAGSANVSVALLGLGELGVFEDGQGASATDHARALADAWVFMRRLENRLAVVQERLGESVRLLNEAPRSAGSPVSEGARRLGLRLGLDQRDPSQPTDTIEALVADYQRYNTIIESATFNILRRNHHGH